MAKPKEIAVEVQGTFDAQSTNVLETFEQVVESLAAMCEALKQQWPDEPIAVDDLVGLAAKAAWVATLGRTCTECGRTLYPYKVVDDAATVQWHAKYRCTQCDRTDEVTWMD